MDSIWKEAEKNIILHVDKINIIESCIDRHTKSTPNKLAFFFENNGKRKEFTYQQLQKEVNKFFNFLKELKVKLSPKEKELIDLKSENLIILFLKHFVF